MPLISGFCRVKTSNVFYHKLYSLSCPLVDTESLPESYTPEEVKDYDPDLLACDQLSKGGVRMKIASLIRDCCKQ